LSRTRFIVASLGVAGVVSGMTFGLSFGSAQAASGAPVSVWETTSNQSQLLASQTGTAFAAGDSSASQVITVSPGTTYQSMTGFGASFTDSSASLVAASPIRTSIMTKLFDPTQGIGLDFLRQPIGASDFSTSLYSYDDLPAGQTDPTLADFSIAHDDSYIIPILQQALAINPQTTIMATPWSPPGWMKTSGSMIGGTLQTADYQVFANYLVKFLQAYQAAGVPVSLITAQNEPEYSPSNYPGSTLTSTQETDFIANNLGPAIKAAGLSTGILDYDHNWNDPSFPETVLGDAAAAQYVVGTAWHCYAGDVSAQTTVEQQYPNYGTYETECSGTEASPASATFADNLDWDTENLIIDATRNYAKTVVTWNMALNPGYGPSMNCTDCTALVTVNNSSGTATYNAEYYSLGQASKFVKPGAVRINSNTFGSGNIEDVAFTNPDGSTALIVLNSNTSSASTFGVDEDGQSFNYTLPAGAVATFTWPASGTSPVAGTIVGNNSGLCLSVSGDSTALKTTADINTCDGDSSENWTVDSNGTIVNGSGLCLSVTGASTALKATADMYTCNGSVSENWTVYSNGTIVGDNSGLCLSVTGASTSPGAIADIYTCNGSVSENWTVG
jgi:glucosylceramidase